MTRSMLYVAAAGLTLIVPGAIAQTATDTATTSDRIRTGGGSLSTDLYGSGNDDAFQSYGAMTFNLTAADFGGAISDIDAVDLTLTFNDRGFSDGTSFGLFFSADDFTSDGSTHYPGLTYDPANAPSGVDANQFTSLTSLGTYALGFDITDAAQGGIAFAYSVNIAAVKAELISEINAGSDFTLLLAAVNDADDITFSGVANTFDPGDPSLSVTAVPEPSAAALGLLALAGLCRRRRGAA